MSDLVERVNSLEQTLTRLNGALETQGHDLDLARQELRASREANEVLSRRLAALEQQVAALSAPPPAPAPPPSPPPVPRGAPAPPDPDTKIAPALVMVIDSRAAR